MAATPKQDFMHNEYFDHVQKEGLSTPPFITDRFWTYYKQVAKEYDVDFLEWNNSNMNIILLSSGLFSAVNTAFIVAMQPDPTTPLLWHSKCAKYYLQDVAYVALSLNLLAAFGAVLHSTFWLLSGLSSTNSGSAITNRIFVERTDKKR
ncbi:uncharacterized protein EDB93DRAFT_1247395 [Suillus bovinus]|uniref:uncharacterized protein n=1 Tax=Suillus bovinus TaxID=48563 RepID=UPI001B87F0AF|nr:uncharacterized protein EDB93DRAFT_1247395 [Suillus bovinus]KAG2156693.1 hypothetical protein EDB93DRAFT_1247395 [Suillus bovinus]